MQNGVQSAPIDELHGIEMEAIVLADPVNWNDVRVVQPGDRAGLAPKPLETIRVSEMMERQDLERHMPAQRLLNRLVDDPHAAGADRSEQDIITQPLRYPGSHTGPAGNESSRVATQGPEFFHDKQSGKDGADAVGQLRMIVGVFRQRRPFTPAVALEE
jgi:hypothetical protein